MFFLAPSAVATVLSLASHCPPAPLAIRLSFVGKGAVTVGAGALMEARRIWAPYGVAIEPMGDESFLGAIVRIELADPPGDGAGSARALGSIEFHDGAPEPSVMLYPARAWALVRRISRLDADHWPLSYREMVLRRVLGRTLAHELGHYVLRSRTHSRTGLMRATQSIADLISPDRSLLALTEEDASRLRVWKNCRDPFSGFFQ